MKLIYILTLLFLLIIVSGCKEELNDLQQDICTQDSDCKLNSGMGGCHTPEYERLRCQEIANKGGGAHCDPVIHPEEARCVCENNKCAQYLTDE